MDVAIEVVATMVARLTRLVAIHDAPAGLDGREERVAAALTAVDGAGERLVKAEEALTDLLQDTFELNLDRRAVLRRTVLVVDYAMNAH